MKFIAQHRRVVAVVLGTVLLLTTYFLGYAFAGRRACFYREKATGEYYCGFCYPYTWQAKLFIPAAAIESFVCNRNIVTGTRDELIWESPVRRHDPISN